MSKFKLFFDNLKNTFWEHGFLIDGETRWVRILFYLFFFFTLFSIVSIILFLLADFN